MKKIKHFMEKYQMITTGDKVIAGVSGGADSVCLFLVLLELRKEWDFDLIAVHVNHGLRGEAADRDEAFVKDLCERYGIPLEVSSVNLVSIAKKRKQSLEEAGRSIRREAFEAACRKYGGNRIALAHHQNDNAETMLMNLARGAGLKGLGGIRPVNGKLIRPLLCMNREEIEAFLTERNQSFCTDETNAHTEYTRNKLRHLVIPVLEKQVNSQAVRHMNETIEQMWELQEYMDQQIQSACDCCVCREEGGALLIQETEWNQYPDILKKQIIRHCLEAVSGKTQNIGQTHVTAVLDLFGKQSGKSLDLPYSVQAVREYEGVRLQKISVPEGAFSPVELKVPGVTYVPERNLTICCNIFPKSGKFSSNDIPQKTYTKWFDYDIIKKGLLIRTKQSGDTMIIDKAGHSQKLKSWFINEKIPARERSSKLLIADGSQIVWIPGHRMSSAYQVSEATQQILQIKVTEEKENDRDN